MARVLELALMAAALSPAAAAAQAQPFPYDRTNPIWYDNDFGNDYVDWYLMVLASAGSIDYRGISTSSSIAPYNQHMTSDQLDMWRARRTKIVEDGRASGFRNVPTPIHGTRGHLVKPSTGRIEDTRPLDSPASRAIVAEARKTTAAKPLVIVVGGPATVAADAYLLDPTIADKVIVGFVDQRDKMGGFNGWADAWAAYIVLQKLRLVQFPIQSQQPRLSKQWLQDNLPDSPAKTHMLGLIPDVVGGADGDPDGMPAAAIMRPDWVKAFKRVSFGGWTDSFGHEVPVFKDDTNGRAIVATQLDGAIATEEYYRAFKNPLAWHSTTEPEPEPEPPAPQSPYGGAAHALPGVVEAEDFDEGGEGVAYHDADVTNHGDEYRSTGVDLDRDSAGGVHVGWTSPGEWLEYAVDVATAGTYTLEVRVACGGPGGTFRVEFGGSDKTGSVAIPDTGAWHAWQTVTVPDITLAAGPQTMRIVMVSKGTSGAVGNIDLVRLQPDGGTAGAAPADSEGENGDSGLNDAVCGALGLEGLLVLAAVALRRRIR